MQKPQRERLGHPPVSKIWLQTRLPQQARRTDGVRAASRGTMRYEPGTRCRV